MDRNTCTAREHKPQNRFVSFLQSCGTVAAMLSLSQTIKYHNFFAGGRR